MSSIPVALQLYSVRDDCKADLPKTLKAVAEMGYDGVEFAGYHGFGAGDLAAMLRDNGLRAAGAHAGIDSLLGDELRKSAEFHNAIGNRFLIVPGLPAEYTISVSAWRRTADVFNDVAGKLKPFGILTGYHNHHTEFTVTPEGMPWEVFLDNTADDVVMQADTGNALAGGVDITSYVRRYPGRARSVHLKDYANGEYPLLGRGAFNWQPFFDACEDVGGTEWYIVEQESYPYPPLECARRCLETYQSMRDKHEGNPA